MNTEKVATELRPYLEIETSMLRSIRLGLVRAMGEIPFTGNAIAVAMQKAAYLAEIGDIDRELAQRN